MVVLEVETSDGVSSAKKRFLGVDKLRNKWRARARNPLLKADVHLGYYKTLEEAAVVAAKKRAEFEEMFKGMDSSSIGNCRGYFQGKKLPKGVRWNNGRYLAQVWHPELKKEVLCGSFKNCEEAANAVDRKRAELHEMYGAKLRVIPDNEVSKEFGCSDEQSSDVMEPMVPRGVRRISSGKWVARIKKPESRDRVWLGTYNTLEMALSAFNKKKAEFDARVNMPECDWVEFRARSEANESQMKFECEFGYDLMPTSLSCAHNLNALDENSNWSPTSVFDPKNMNTASVGDKTFDSEFDRAVSLGIINEYGQLLGKYSEIDAQMWLTNM
ncbi:uncharacterized protein LOC141598926 [Silene latifolia]|uniref:uncharacterized protein LOC141598926 n=1 Tax=Silene latifolia TaxID=37657 RepID=UPI003D77021D